MRLAVLLAIGTLAAAAACSSSGTSSTSSGGGGTPDSGVATTDASASDAATPDATTDAADSGCNDLALPATAAPWTQVAQAAPSPAGGTIADGTYVLTKIETFTGPGGATGNAGTAHSIVRFAGTHMDTFGDVGGVLFSSAQTYTTSGTDITYAITCPNPTTAGPIPYTADGTHFEVFTNDGTNTSVATWTKQ